METRRISTLTLNFQEVQAEYSKKKMFKKCDRSRYVYENKQKSDKTADKKSGISAQPTRFLPKKAPL